MFVQRINLNINSWEICISLIFRKEGMNQVDSSNEIMQTSIAMTGRTDTVLHSGAIGSATINPKSAQTQAQKKSNFKP